MFCSVQMPTLKQWHDNSAYCLLTPLTTRFIPIEPCFFKLAEPCKTLPHYSQSNQPSKDHVCNFTGRKVLFEVHVYVFNVCNVGYICCIVSMKQLLFRNYVWIQNAHCNKPHVYMVK